MIGGNILDRQEDWRRIRAFSGGAGGHFGGQLFRLYSDKTQAMLQEGGQEAQLLKAIEAPHKKLHESAIEIGQAYGAGDIAGLSRDTTPRPSPPKAKSKGC